MLKLTGFLLNSIPQDPRIAQAVGNTAFDQLINQLENKVARLSNKGFFCRATGFSLLF